MIDLCEVAVGQILLSLLGKGAIVDRAVIKLLAVLLEKILTRLARITANVAGSARRSSPNALDVALAISSFRLPPPLTPLPNHNPLISFSSLWPVLPRTPALPLRPDGLPLPFYDHHPPLPPPHTYRHTELKYRREEERWQVAMRRAEQQQLLEEALYRLLQISQPLVDYEDHE